MKIKAILFDLDGTLLPMDQEAFVSAYLGGLIKLLSPIGYDPKDVEAALRSSTRAMMTNDGKITNEEMFWQSFTAVLGEGIRNHGEAFDLFYKEEFKKLKSTCGYNPRAREIVELAKSRGARVILATSPLFPGVATETRMGWTGLTPSDFEHVTTYENSRFCKPNPVYYTNLISELGLRPEECVMIGNDVGDDMVAESVGIRCFLLTDYLINRKNVDICQFRHGDYDELTRFIKEIIDEH
jgi:FMN phosphatase YigB (HAD superfamily)